MDYAKQRAFLARQRRRLFPAVAACGLLLTLTLVDREPLWSRVLAGGLAIGLLWAAYYLPNYLGLDAATIRRPRWAAKARWFLLFLTLAIVVAARAKYAITAVLAAGALHLALLRILRKPLSPDLRDADPPRLRALAFTYAATDFALLWLARRGGTPDILLAELVVAFAFLAIVLLRPSAAIVQIFSGVAVAALLALFIVSPERRAASTLACAAVFLWTAGVARLVSEAVEQNRENFEDLVQNLQEFCKESRETVVRMMAESVARLAEDWHRSRPQGQAAVSAWYSRNARLYLYANCQHHLLYKHIAYTLGLLRLAHGLVLDFGGGNGNFSRALARRGVDITYLDVPGESADYLRWRAAREHLPLKIAYELDTLTGPYDVVYCLDVIEHLVDLPPVFAKWKELLRSGGRLVATYYNGPNSTAPMHIDPGYDARDFLLRHGFRDVKPAVVGLFSPELMRKSHFMILEKEGS